MRRHSFRSDSALRTLGVVGIVGFVALALCSDANVLTRFHIMNAAKAEDGLIGGFHISLGDEGAMPDLDGAIGWLNSAPLSSKSLRGKVVLVDFWTYTCINSLRPLPFVKSWAEKYKDAGLVVIGVHTPEFSFEREPAPLTAITRFGRRTTTSTGRRNTSQTRKGDFGTTTLGKATMAISSAPSRNS
jgi:thiol-disulfide isomerase/thioredoxin